ncbi:MAG: protein with DOMON-like ligand-binding domain protein, partial [Bizionia sp.]|nr:protein with DOMON-like ligand-binding domain protein [Bizionia sp.]
GYNPDINFNSWNLDLSYSWQFAPGSQLTALYRNSIFNFSNASQDHYFESLDKLFDENMRNTFSFKMVYFIDYNAIKNILKKKSKII